MPTPLFSPQTVSHPGQPSVALPYVRLLLDQCRLHGLTRAELLAQAGVPDPLAGTGEDSRIPFTDFMRLCDSAETLLNDPDLALKVGQAIRPGHYGIHGHSVMSAPTLRDCLDRSLRYHALVHNGGRNLLRFEGELAVMCYQSNLPDQAGLGRFQNELCLSAWTAFARWVTGLENHPAAWVSFSHPQPASTDLHQQLFRCPLHFSAPRTAAAFPAILLDLPNPQANPTVVRIMDDLSERALHNLDIGAEPDWLTQARRLIAQQLPQGLPTLHTLAAALALPPAALRQHLKQRHLLLSELLDDTRRQLALGYLRDPTLSLLDITYLLGFSEQSAFNRAFKRWTGSSPGQHRQTLAHTS